MDRLMARTDTSNDCWMWQGGTNSDGYGKIYFQGRSHLAHRVMAAFTFGQFDQRLRVCHTCDVPQCINPAHLFLGTQSQNMRDCASKRRLGVQQKPKRTHCKHGHEYTPENTRMKRGARECRTCDRQRKGNA